ncbi:hypothetical protein ACLOJK_013346 [Asimina triloba]
MAAPYRPRRPRRPRSSVTRKGGGSHARATIFECRHATAATATALHVRSHPRVMCTVIHVSLKSPSSGGVRRKRFLPSPSLQLHTSRLLQLPCCASMARGANASDLWNEMDGREQSEKKLVFYTLSALYALLAFVALIPNESLVYLVLQLTNMEDSELTIFVADFLLIPTLPCVDSSSDLFCIRVQLFRIQLRVPEFGWTTQKVFHLMNFVVNGCKDRDAECVPGQTKKIYHQARSTPVDSLRPAYFGINGVVYFLQICIWIYLRISPNPVVIEVAKLFLAAVSFVAALGFLIYGGRLFFMLRRFPIESRGRQKKLNEVALSAFDENADVDVINHDVLNFVYYMLVEIIPSALVLFILRKLPPRRVSDQYHPIS